MNEFNNDRDDQNTNLTPEGNQAQQQTPPTYVWDGKQGGNRRRGKKPFMFFVVAIVCLVLTTAICVPTVLYALDEGHIASGSGDTSDGTASRGEASREDVSYDVSQTVSITDTPFQEENVLTQVYEKCQGSCATIYVELGNTGYSIGSGFVLTEDGYVATNQHVVDDGTKVTPRELNKERQEWIIYKMADEETGLCFLTPEEAEAAKKEVLPAFRKSLAE